MGSGARAVLVAAWLAAAAGAVPALRAQAPTFLPPPSLMPDAAEPPPAAPLPPPSLPPPPGEVHVTYIDGPLDPGRDGWGPYGPPAPPPGWFLGADLALVHPVVRSRISNNDPLPKSGSVLDLPNAKLSWTASPWFDLGYRLPDDLGLVSLNYRFVIAEGNGSAAASGQGPADLHSRLTQHVINIDYGTTPFAFLPHWDFEWRFGVEFADVFFDSLEGVGKGSFEQVSNNFRGAGPHTRLDLEHPLGAVPGLALFGRLEGAVDFGRISQKFREGSTGSKSGNTTVTDFAEQNSMQTVPTLLVQAGLQYCPPRLPRTRWTLGYVYEHWWYVGQLGEDGANGNITDTKGDVDTMGVFLRGQVNY
jgi:hypothetical protein